MKMIQSFVNTVNLTVPSHVSRYNFGPEVKTANAFTNANRFELIHADFHPTFFFSLPFQEYQPIYFFVEKLNKFHVHGCSLFSSIRICQNLTEKNKTNEEKSRKICHCKIKFR